MEMKLNSEEAELLKVVLSQLTIEKRTGVLGVMHGMDRFVSTQVSFKRQHLDLLDHTARRLGLMNGINRTEK